MGVRLIALAQNTQHVRDRLDYAGTKAWLVAIVIQSMLLDGTVFVPLAPWHQFRP